LGLLAFGVWWWGVREERFSAQRAGEIKNEKLKIENEGDGEDGVDVQLSSYLLTPGPVRRKVEGKEIVTSINGRFVGWEEIKGSEDRYLILDAGEGQVGGNRSDGPYFKVRVVFVPEPDKGIKDATQLSVIATSGMKGRSISSRLREVGYFGQLPEERLNFFLPKGVWLKAILYLKDNSPLMDDKGSYYALAISASETL